MLEGGISGARGEGTHPELVIEAGTGEPLRMPADFPLQEATFSRSGSDLIVVAPDGSTAVVRRYFADDTPPALEMAGGGLLTGGLVSRLAGPRVPGHQVAEVGQGAPEEPVGRVETVTGQAVAVRASGERVTLHTGDPIHKGDVIETGDGGAVGLAFADETSFSLGEKGRVVLEEMTFDPTAQTGSANFMIMKGAFSFVSGMIARSHPDGMTIHTPTASLGIRGTAGGGVVSAPGDLLPDGSVSKGGETVASLIREVGGTGELIVSSGGVTQVLNQANQAAVVAPGQPPVSTVMSPVEMARSFGSALTANPRATSELPQTFRATIEKAVQEHKVEKAVQQATEKAQGEVKAAEAARTEAAVKAVEATKAKEAAKEAAAEKVVAEKAVAEAVAKGDVKGAEEAKALVEAKAAAEAKALAAANVAEAARASLETTAQALTTQAAQTQAVVAQTQAEHAQVTAELKVAMAVEVKAAMAVGAVFTQAVVQQVETTIRTDPVVARQAEAAAKTAVEQVRQPDPAGQKNTTDPGDHGEKGVRGEPPRPNTDRPVETGPRPDPGPKPDASGTNGPKPDVGMVTGPLTGPITGPLTGPLTGPVTGPFTGPLTGPVTGPFTGPLTGPITGQITGPLTGPITGQITGPLTGPITGQITGP
ncbi:MAG: FecR domain-containing protein, partial [Alphaproteobacteria bacterium]